MFFLPNSREVPYLFFPINFVKKHMYKSIPKVQRKNPTLSVYYNLLLYFFHDCLAYIFRNRSITFVYVLVLIVIFENIECFLFVEN